MDEVPGPRPAPRIYDNNCQYKRPVPNHFSHNATSSRQSCRRRINTATANNVPPALRGQVTELRSAKANLQRTYAQEQNIQSLSLRCTGITFSLPEVVAARARAERRYVNCLVRYLRDTNRMSAMEARQLQGNYTKQKMKKVGLNNYVYLLGMYPYELK